MFKKGKLVWQKKEYNFIQRLLGIDKIVKELQTITSCVIQEDRNQHARWRVDKW